MTLLHHWHTLGWIGLVVAIAVAMQVFLPGVLPAVLRWIIGTQWGRMLILAAVALVCMQFYGDARFSAGRDSVLAKQKAAADRARVDAAVSALNGYMAGAAASASIESNRDKGHADAQATRGRVIAGLHAGDLQLRDHWGCVLAPDKAAPASSRRDDAADLRETGAGDLVQVGDAADADLAACQAQVTLYQRIGVLKP